MSEARPINILLVEDDRVDVMNVQRAFRNVEVEHPLWVARDGLEALEMLRGDRVPLERLIVLLDLNMPRMGGIEFLQEVRTDERLRWLTVVVLTTSDSENDLVEAYNLNVAGYLVKPVTFESFVDLVKRLNSYWTAVELP